MKRSSGAGAVAQVKGDHAGSSKALDVHAGESLLEALQRSQRVYIDAACGGTGTCGKCAVKASGELSAPDAIEQSLISPAYIAKGVRLACRTLIEGDCEIELPSDGKDASILSSFEPLVAANDPLVTRRTVHLPSASLEDQRPAVRRLAEELGIAEAQVPIEVRRRLMGLAERESLSVLLAEDRVIDVDPEPRDHLFGAAVDIGTTTVVVYLVDLDTGLVLGSRSAINPQKAFGADVISRIAHASRGADELRALQQRIVGRLQELVGELAADHAGCVEDVVAMTVAGNTTMLHLLAGIDPAAIARSPFAPQFLDALRLEARELGLQLHPRALLWVLPGVSAYVGGDIVAGIVSTDMDRSEKPVLLIDLGTNCEVVLGSSSGMVACATAAGPAFEGAEIECGMPGVAGAVSRVWCDGALHVETIGGKAACGVCGSGILDTTALLAESGLVDSTGRLCSHDEALELQGVPPGLASLVDDGKSDGDPASRSGRLLLTAGSPANGDAVFFSQRDVRQVQLAKAAVAAGIQILVSELGVSVSDVEALYLSGGFGNAMKPESACRIGLFPKELLGKVRAVGNTAGRGAVLALRSRAELARLEQVSRGVRYVELSGHSLFMDSYIDHMTFPEANEMEGIAAVSLKTPSRPTSSDDRLSALFPEVRPPLTPDEAIVEANRCLDCGGPYGVAPCVTACPTKVDVPGFITAIARGETARAADIIFNDNILGASCARVCPVEQLCEGACVYVKQGQRPVAIGKLQRFAAESELGRRTRFRTPGRPNGKRVSVIGAGPAGLSCAAELALKGYRVVVHDKNEDHGGLVRYGIAPYRLHRDPLPLEMDMIAALGVEFRLGSNVDAKEKLQAIEAESDAIFLGIGLGGDVTLHYPGDKLAGVWTALDFVRAIKTGELPAVGALVAVFGGGNTAIDVAREALRLGAREVTLYYRRSREEMPAYPHEIEEATDEGVRFGFLTQVNAFQGTNRLESIELQRMRLADPDSSGRPGPEPIPNTQFQVMADTAILAIGQEHRAEFLNWIEGIDLDHGLIRIDPASRRTSNLKYFAGGDSLNGGATAVEAVQDGKLAAEGIDRCLRGF